MIMNCDNCINTNDGGTCDLTGETYPPARSCRQWAHKPGTRTSAPVEPPEPPEPPDDAHARHSCACSRKHATGGFEDAREVPKREREVFWGHANTATGEGVLYRDEDLANRVFSPRSNMLFVRMAVADESDVIEEERKLALAKLTAREQEILGLEG